MESLLSSLEKADKEILAEKKLVKMLNRVLTESEVSAPHVIHLCLGNKDNYSSHQFKSANMHLMLSWLVEEENIHDPTNESDIVTNDVWMKLERTENEEYILINQELDYHKRGMSLSNMCFYDYVAEIEKIKWPIEESNSGEENKRGRPTLPRFDYE